MSPDMPPPPIIEGVKQPYSSITITQLPSDKSDLEKALEEPVGEAQIVDRIVERHSYDLEMHYNDITKRLTLIKIDETGGGPSARSGRWTSVQKDLNGNVVGFYNFEVPLRGVDGKPDLSERYVHPSFSVHRSAATMEFYDPNGKLMLSHDLTDFLIPRLERILEKNPSNFDTRNYLGLAYMARARSDKDNAINLYEKAIEEFEKVLEKNPDFEPSLINRATAYEELEKLQKEHQTPQKEPKKQNNLSTRLKKIYRKVSSELGHDYKLLGDTIMGILTLDAERYLRGRGYKV